MSPYQQILLSILLLKYTDKINENVILQINITISCTIKVGKLRLVNCY